MWCDRFSLSEFFGCESGDGKANVSGMVICSRGGMNFHFHGYPDEGKSFPPHLEAVSVRDQISSSQAVFGSRLSRTKLRSGRRHLGPCAGYRLKE